MCNSNCCCKWGGCTTSKTVKIILIVGGLNWGLVGLGMLTGNGMDWNIVRMLFYSVQKIEALIYVIVGAAAVMQIFGCKCTKCKEACGTCNMERKM